MTTDRNAVQRWRDQLSSQDEANLRAWREKWDAEVTSRHVRMVTQQVTPAAPDTWWRRILRAIWRWC